MRSLVAALAVMAAFPSFAGLGKASVPDAKEDGRAAYARRGSLGSDDYVATNVYSCASAYLRHDVKDGTLLNRAVNSVFVEAESVTFEIPGDESVKPYARGFMVVVTSTVNTRLSFEGAERLYSSDGTELMPVVAGGTILLSFIEIRKDEFLVEMRDLTEIRKGT